MGRVLIGIAAIFYGVETFSAPIALPRSPARKIDARVDSGRPLIGYLTGAILLVAGACILLGKEDAHGGDLSRHLDCAAGRVCLWADPDRVRYPTQAPRVKVEGINYFVDTLLFAGVILALASATPRTD